VPRPHASISIPYTHKVLKTNCYKEKLTLVFLKMGVIYEFRSFRHREHLGRRVDPRRSNELSQWPGKRAVQRQHAVSKICQLRLEAVAHQHIRGLQVAVNDAKAVVERSLIIYCCCLIYKNLFPHTYLCTVLPMRHRLAVCTGARCRSSNSPATGRVVEATRTPRTRTPSSVLVAYDPQSRPKCK
jgi:hypothetical protein